MRRLEVALNHLRVVVSINRPKTDAERFNGMARRYMTDAVYRREVDDRGRRDLQHMMTRCEREVEALRDTINATRV